MITALGWLGTGLVVLSYAQPNEMRLRRLSLVASVVLIVFNAALGIWSNVVLEVMLVGINGARLRRAGHAGFAAAESCDPRTEPVPAVAESV